MKNREVSKLIAQNIIDAMFEHIKEVTQNENQENEVLSQIKNLLK
jgi:hypothetical protein